MYNIELTSNNCYKQYFLRYHLFKISSIYVASEVLDRNATSIFFDVYDVYSMCSFKMNLKTSLLFKTEIHAKYKQAIDLHNILLNRYRPLHSVEQDLIDYYTDLITLDKSDDFIKFLTGHQLYYREYVRIIQDLLEHHPEYFI